MITNFRNKKGIANFEPNREQFEIVKDNASNF